MKGPLGANPEDWNDSPRKLTSMERYQLAALPAIQAQCTRCMGLSKQAMLCQGLRLEYNAQASILYGAPKFTHQPCEKLVAKRRLDRIRKTLDASCIPKKVIEDWQFERSQKGYGSALRTRQGIEVNGKLLPVAMFELHTDELHKQAVDVALTIIHNGLSARVVLLPVLLAKHSNWTNFVSEFGSLAFLALERYDMGLMPDFIMDSVAAMLDLRVESGRPTLVTTGARPKVRGAVDSAMYDKMRDWESLSEALL